MRLFVAIELSAAVKQLLRRVQADLRHFDTMVRWTRPEQMHLTLQFLGEVGEDRLADVRGALAEAAAAAAPFDFTCRGAGCFPPHGRARIVWVGLDDAGGRLAQCQRLVEDWLAQAGFPREDRPFTPHLTAGRVTEDRSAGALRDAVAALPAAAVSQPVHGVRLMRSELLPQGARYTVVAEWPLGRPV